MSTFNTPILPLVKRIYSQVLGNQLVSVQPMSPPKYVYQDIFDVVYDDLCELKPIQLEFIEYLKKILLHWDMLDEILESGKYNKKDISILNTLREQYSGDFIKYKNDKLQKI